MRRQTGQRCRCSRRYRKAWAVSSVLFQYSGITCGPRVMIFPTVSDGTSRSCSSTIFTTTPRVGHCLSLSAVLFITVDLYGTFECLGHVCGVSLPCSFPSALHLE